MNLSDRYAEWLDGGSRVQELPPSSPLQSPREVPEEELQARWFAGEFGRDFVTTDGDRVSVLDFGVWNREPGPVFSGAQLSFRGEPALRGGINVHTQPREIDPEDQETRLFVLPGGGIGGSRTAWLGMGPMVLVDVTSLEFGKASGESSGCRCETPLGALREETIRGLLEAAAQYRLCRKAARLGRLCRQSGPGEGLYQAVAETLGYRHNKLPFTLLAQRFPLALLRKQLDEIEPLLFSGSGFLPGTELGAMPDDSRGYLREIWNRWWPQRVEYERLMVPSALWNLGATRPVNHPQRRVAALGEIVRNWPVIESFAASCDVAAIRAFFAGLQHPYWDSHYTLTSRRSARRMALVGQTRVTDMLANVFFPAAIVAEPRRWKAYCELPSLDSNQKLEEAVARLFGEAPLARRLLKKAVYQQGLLQLFEDHCERCGLECGSCRLLDLLNHWRE
jgi:hypothetical protein